MHRSIRSFIRRSVRLRSFLLCAAPLLLGACGPASKPLQKEILGWIAKGFFEEIGSGTAERVVASADPSKRRVTSRGRAASITRDDAPSTSFTCSDDESVVGCEQASSFDGGVEIDIGTDTLAAPAATRLDLEQLETACRHAAPTKGSSLVEDAARFNACVDAGLIGAHDGVVKSGGGS